MQGTRKELPPSSNIQTHSTDIIKKDIIFILNIKRNILHGIVRTIRYLHSRIVPKTLFYNFEIKTKERKYLALLLYDVQGCPGSKFQVPGGIYQLNQETRQCKQRKINVSP